MVRSAFGYRAEITTWSDDRPVQTVELAEPDWEPALQWSYFQQIRAGARQPMMRCLDGCIEPVWDPALGQPFVSALRVRPGARRAAARSVAIEIPTRYLRPAVEHAASRLVTEGRLVAGEPFRFRVVAGPAPSLERRLPGHDDGVHAVPIAHRLPIAAASIARLGASAERDAIAADPVDLRVVVHASVLEAAVSLAAATPDAEAGGVLVGALCRDVDDGDLFLDVRALLPARHAVAQPDRLTFTPETWADAHAAIALRGNDECFVGWAHSHPFFCRDCTPAARRTCALALPFFSEQDRSLHRTVFGRPFDVALLVSDGGPSGHSCALFGWRRGMIERRGYSVAGHTAAASSPATPSSPARSDDGPGVAPRLSESRSTCGGRDARAPD